MDCCAQMIEKGHASMDVGRGTLCWGCKGACGSLMPAICTPAHAAFSFQSTTRDTKTRVVCLCVRSGTPGGRAAGSPGRPWPMRLFRAARALRASGWLHFYHARQEAGHSQKVSDAGPLWSSRTPLLRGVAHLCPSPPPQCSTFTGMIPVYEPFSPPRACPAGAGGPGCSE